MSWNYRVFKRTVEEEDCYSIRSIYYDKKDKADSWATTDTIPSGNTPSELLDELVKMFVAVVTKPVLEVVDGKLVEVKE
jgi:hypothetical protein